jgi:ABC-2 type transport system ATP-binding protein
MMSLVIVNDVTKQFDDFYAVKDLSFEVQRGSIYGFLGPNGAGKTTTIRMIVNIFAPDSGEIIVMGEPASPHIQRRIGYLPEERGLYRKMKVGKQLLFFGRLKGLQSGEAKKRVDQWLSKLELSDWADKEADQLSKGMQQKVQFIASMLHDPELLILDEPFSGLDPVSVSLLKEVILELKQMGKTIIFSTHQMEQVEQLCDEICLINQATKVLEGRLRDVKSRLGRNTVLIAYDGAAPFLLDDLATKVNRYPNYVEVLLNTGADPQKVLTRALAAGARINRFELVEPSLNDIFIETCNVKAQQASVGD